MTFEEALEEIKAEDEECRKVIEEAERNAEEYLRKSMDDKKYPCCEMKITIEDFSKLYNVSIDKVETFLRNIKIDTNKVREFEESKLKMFLPMMK